MHFHGNWKKFQETKMVFLCDTHLTPGFNVTPVDSLIRKEYVRLALMYAIKGINYQKLRVENQGMEGQESF